MLILQKIALVLTIIGGINWALIGIADFNPVTFFFENSVMTKIIYVVIGACAIFNIVLLFIHGFFRKPHEAY